MANHPVFTRLLDIEVSNRIKNERRTGKNPEIPIRFKADGRIPFPQIIARLKIDGQVRQEHLIRDHQIEGPEVDGQTFAYTCKIPASVFDAGELEIQVEGCRVTPIELSRPQDWIKVFRSIELMPSPRIEVGNTIDDGGVKIYFGIHKHMHQPYYDAVDSRAWDGQKDEIFGSRHGPYTHYLWNATRQYEEGALEYGGLSTSWSGSLIEQLNRCDQEGLCGNRFRAWKKQLKDATRFKTALGNPRLDFTAFGFFHPLMALIPGRDIRTQIDWHRKIIQETFNVDPSPILFPPETAFHVRMIPALVESGIKAVIYDSIHRFRSCKGYPYAGLTEGMLPPNPAEQENEAVSDWLQLHNIWAGSKISPSLLKPEYVKYESPDGEVHRIIAVPAERYIGNEDARGGFGALQYPDVLDQVRREIIKHNSFDPKHPPFFLLHSDGDNHGGGAESYYGHNTGQLVQWLQRDRRFELISIRDYLDRFPPDPERAVHLEPGSWSGADNGDPHFRKWFSRYNEDYSPDLNSWAVLTALQNAVHTLQDAKVKSAALERAHALLLTAETSCYWYWTGQEVWDRQVTAAANEAMKLIGGELETVLGRGKDKTGPTIFAPWVFPENPGEKTWGPGCLVNAPRQGRVHTFVDDVSGVKRVVLVVRSASGERNIDMTDRGAYPSKTGPTRTSHHYTAEFPIGLGDIRYYIEAEDSRGNVSRSSLERIFLA